MVIELKIGPFQPEHAGKLGFYVTWVDANLRQPSRHSPTIGILLCAGRSDSLVRYTLAGSTAPLAIANYTYNTLPPAARAAVPPDIQLANAAGVALNQLTANPDTVAGPGPGDQPDGPAKPERKRRPYKAP